MFGGWVLVPVIVGLVAAARRLGLSPVYRSPLAVALGLLLSVGSTAGGLPSGEVLAGAVVRGLALGLSAAGCTRASSAGWTRGTRPMSDDEWAWRSTSSRGCCGCVLLEVRADHFGAMQPAFDARMEDARCSCRIGLIIRPGWHGPGRRDEHRQSGRSKLAREVSPYLLAQLAAVVTIAPLPGPGDRVTRPGGW